MEEKSNTFLVKQHRTVRSAAKPVTYTVTLKTVKKTDPEITMTISSNTNTIFNIYPVGETVDISFYNLQTTLEQIPA